jgi:hypothetical protein
VKTVRRAVAALAVALPLALAGPAPAATALGGCPVFPTSNAWNRDISKLPVDPRSGAYIASINSGNRFLHADFGGGGQYGIPYRVVPRTQPRVPIRFTDYGDESDPGPYPVPLNAPVENGSDRHVLVLQRGTCRLFEMFNAQRSGAGWAASSGAVFNLRSNRLRHETWTSADAAGLPILPGLARYDEVRRGRIDHALRFTVQRTRRAFVWPARHFASSLTDPALPRMGERLRLKASVSLAGLGSQARVVARALQTYGMLLADNGSNWYVSGAPNSRWNNDDLHTLGRLRGSDFEVVDASSLRP